MPDSFVHDPDETVDYVRDWSADLGEDTIDDSTWTAPVGITVDSDSFTDSTATVWISGGTAWETYEVLNRITTAGGRTLDHTLRFIVRSK